MYEYLKGGCKEEGSRFFSVVQTEAQDVLPENQEILFHCESGRALA